MSDEVDLTTERQLFQQQVMEQNARYDLPPGQPGECEFCGEWFSRLIGGACGFCRDKFKLP